jgi:RalA-binding protein 1
VVYRSIEYLRAKNASSEEGIFRLSGSNIVIKALKERFNTEGDVKLLEGQYYDIHAVASLLKLYLRELPASILTREHHLEFLKGLDVDEKIKVEVFNVLVNKLPRANRELLDILSTFLREIVDREGINKMSVRNGKFPVLVSCCNDLLILKQLALYLHRHSIYPLPSYRSL